MCATYFQARSFLAPHVQPYYDAYGSHYIEAARPYVNTFQSKVFNPAYGTARSAYVRYGAPRVGEAWRLGGREWQSKIAPRLSEWQELASIQYRNTLGPYFLTFQSHVGPYLGRAWTVAQIQYETIVIPTYEKSLPYLHSAYKQSKAFALETGIPYTQFALETTFTFVRRRIWPPIRVLYGRNVEPQLSKIKERLGSYRDSRSLEAAAEALDECVNSAL